MKIIIKDGKGKEYDIYDKLIFEGEYLNGERNGKGKEYYNGEIAFEGEYLNGKRNGNGKEYYYDKLIFEDEYLNGEKNGKGKEFYCKNDKLKFEGEYYNGKSWNGNGYNINSNVEFEIKDGKGNIKEYDFIFW